MENNEENKGIGYKIEAGKQYRLWRKDYNGRTYYNIQISQKNYDGTISKWYRPVTFKQGIELPNETDIVIKKAIENLRPNAKDPYNPITSLMILEYEESVNQEALEQQAYADFRENLGEADEDDYDPDLPF